jgi:hypothetical protein
MQIGQQRIRRYEAEVTYRDALGRDHEEVFPVRSRDHQEATRLAFAYAISVLRLGDFDLRIVGS